MERTELVAKGKPSVSSAVTGSTASSSASSSGSAAIMGIQRSPCAGCKFLRRKCQPDCVFAPYFPADQPDRFISVHKSFGASNVSKILNGLHPEDREFAAASLVYEASRRHSDRVNGCVNDICMLEEKLKELRFCLSISVAEMYRCKAVVEALSNGNQASQGVGKEQMHVPGISRDWNGPDARTMALSNGNQVSQGIGLEQMHVPGVSRDWNGADARTMALSHGNQVSQGIGLEQMHVPGVSRDRNGADERTMALSHGNQVSQGIGLEQMPVPIWQQQQQHLLQQQLLQRMMVMMGGHGALDGEAGASGGAYDSGLVEEMDASTAGMALAPLPFGGQFAGFSAAGEHGMLGHGHGYDVQSKDIWEGSSNKEIGNKVEEAWMPAKYISRFSSN